MLKHATLGRRIGVGFGSLLAILAVLGLVAVTNMVRVKTKATMLATEYVPEVAVANDVERTSLHTMYEMRGFVYSRDAKFHDEMTKALGEVKGHLDEAGKLATASPHLVKLKDQVPQAQAAVADYEKLAGESKALLDQWQAAEDSMNKAAPEFVNAATEYRTSGEESLAKDAATSGAAAYARYQKIKDINSALSTGNLIRIAAWKTSALRDVTVMQKELPKFDEIAKTVNGIKADTRQASNIKRLDTVLSTAAAYKKACQEMVDVLAKLDDVNKLRGEAADKVLAAAEEVSKAGIDITKKSTTEAAGALATSSAILIIGLLVALGLGIFLAITI
ncbi:MAG: methyl-accepting chemotaxis protein, partial [Fimbriimonadaceae bacterium]|nr:methyl-accepting chemotaxis protein [Fimbriimonadaceae bacterium]